MWKIGTIYLVIIILIAVFFSCETKRLKQSEESLTLVALGVADSLTDVNKGFSARVYCFIDFNNDSVLVRDNPIYDSICAVKTGRLNGVTQNQYVKSTMRILDSLENGERVGKLVVLDTQYPELYCGWNIFVEYKKSGNSKWFYTSNYTIESLVELINFMLKEPILKENNSIVIEDDDLISPIVNREGFELNYPPPVKTIIKFLPPKVDSVAN